MAKFHINKHGVPAPCKAKPGNCPLGGDEQHYSSQEEAQEAIDNTHEEQHHILHGLGNVSEQDSNEGEIQIDKEAKRLISLIGKRKNSVEPPRGVRRGIKNIDDLDTTIELDGSFITKQEHDPVKNVQSMFDHVAGKSGKLYRYDENNPHLETHDYDFEGNVRNLRDILERDNTFESYNEDNYFEDMHGKTAEEAFEENIATHRKLYDYSRDLAVEYGVDFEKKVYMSGKYTPEEQDELQAEYRRALADKVGYFIEGYGEDEDW